VLVVLSAMVGVVGGSGHMVKMANSPKWFWYLS
jgi:hypothetical protein